MTTRSNVQTALQGRSSAVSLSNNQNQQVIPTTMRESALDSNDPPLAMPMVGLSNWDKNLADWENQVDVSNQFSVTEISYSGT
jgi:hypothetical protein